MVQVNIHQAKTQLSKLVEEAAAGEEIIIVKAGKPIAKLVPLKNNNRKPRTSGSLQGKIKVSEDFDAPMSDEELALWYEAAIFPNQRSYLNQASKSITLPL